MAIHQQLITRWIGDAPHKFSIAVGKDSVSGYMSRNSTDIRRAERQVLTNQDVAENRGVRLFCGFCDDVVRTLGAPEIGVYLYAVPRINEEGIVVLGMVGVQRDYVSPEAIRLTIQDDPNGVFATSVRTGRDTIDSLADPYPPEKQARRVRTMLKKIYDRCPYRIYFADRKGLKARFREEVSRKDAVWIAKRIESINIEAFNAVEPSSMEDYIVRRKTLRLWWD